MPNFAAMTENASTPSTLQQPYRVLLYYNFTPVADPQAARDEMEAHCIAEDLLGRILVAPEGINGTVSGTWEATQRHIDWMRQHPTWNTTEFKIDQHDGHAFLKLHVRVRPEIVFFGVEQLDMTKPVNNYVEPEAWREMMKSNDPDIIILDARSNYEHEVGKFKGAITLDIDNFRELPAKLAELEAYKDKKIYTYCTGGIKCEKVSRLMMQEGFENVYQLHGGIVRYGHEVGGEDFDGACYVFDQRVVVPVNNVNPDTISQCRTCQTPTEKYINCANPECNEHFLICDECADRLEGCCSEACMENPRRRQWDGRGYYLRGLNSKLFVNNPDPNYLKNTQIKDKR
jgi:UPF0176 protein